MVSFRLHRATRGMCNPGPKVSIYTTIVACEYAFYRSSFPLPLEFPVCFMEEVSVPI